MSRQSQNCLFFPAQLCSELPLFAQKIAELCQLLGLDATHLEADHIAMRINHPEAAELAELLWSECGTVISKAQINGRPIVVIKLDHPVNIGIWTTSCIELPYPLPGKAYSQQGWEHVEFVIPVEAGTGDELVDAVKQAFPELAERWTTLASSGVAVKVSSPQGEGERLANPTLAFKWNHVCVKLHPHSLIDVIASEQSHD